MKRRLGERGFTLVELLVVLGIIAVLTTVVLASLNGARARARDTRRIAELGQIADALQIYYLRNDQYPSEADANAGSTGKICADSVTCPGDINGILNQYMGGIPTDPINDSRYYYYYDGYHTCLNPGADAVLFTFLESGSGNATEVCTALPIGTEPNGDGARTDAYYIVLGEGVQ